MLRKKNLLLVITLILLVFLVIGCSGLFPKPTKGIIRGRVLIPPAGKALSKDISGWVPAAGAEVTIVDASGVTHTILTDEKGYFSFENIAVKANTIITATVQVNGKTIILKAIIEKAVAQDQVYDVGTMTPESTALALVVEQLVAEGAPIDLDEIKAARSYKNLLKKVNEVLEEYGNVAEDSNVSEAVGDTVEEIINPPAPPAPTPPGGGGGGATPQPKSGSISGIVTNDAGGPPVEGSKIEVKKGDEVIAETITDASGEYSIKNIKTGTYDVIASKSDRASSKIQNVKVEANKTTIADIIHFQKNVPGWECVPPTITVTGIEDGGTYSGQININVSIQDDSDIKYFFIGIGYIPNEYLNDFHGSPVSMYINTPSFLNGENKLYFVAYDMNYNRSQLCITVKINNESTGSKPDAPTNLWPMAITMGKNAGIFSIERDNPISSNSTKKGLDPLNIPGKNENIDLNAIIKAAPADSNIYVRVTWNVVNGATGYKVYRKFEGEQNYKYIGDAPWNTTKYHDLSPELAVGKKVWYQVSAYNSYGESDRSDEEWTAPLPKFNVNLVSPVNGATEVSLIPTLQWQPEGIVGNKQRYGVCLIGKNDEDYIYSPEEDPYYIWNDTSFTITEPLQPLKIYEWNIYDAIAYDYDESIGRDRAMSIAGSGNGALNGAFQFSTGKGQ